MKNREVINRIIKYHPNLPDYNGCDEYKYGNPGEECRGIVCALVPTVEVIRKTADLGCNLLIVHEPTFYSTPDFPDWRGGFENKIYNEKCKLLDDLGITIWRDHDHMHAHNPDSIFTGVIKYLGWEQYQMKEAGNSNFIYKFELPPMTVRELEEHLMKTLAMNGMRVIGNPNSVISKVAIVGHLYPDSFGISHENMDGTYCEYATLIMKEMENGVDAIIPGEIIEWTVLSYIRDAVQLGKNKAVFNIGHFNIEELGMKFAAEWISDLVEGCVPVHYVPTGDIFDFVTVVR